jgi:RNA polymerase sigma-70 factor, ECF subfamily
MAPAAPASALGPGDEAGTGAAEAPAAARPPPFEAVYGEHFDFVWRSVQRLGAPPDAVADLVQEVFLIVHRALPSFEGRSSLKSWLFGVVVNVVRRARRGAQRRRHAMPEPNPPADPDALADANRPGPADSAERAEAVRVLYGLLDELDDGQREAFVMAELEHMTAPEIGEALGLNVHTVYSSLPVRRGRQVRERRARRLRDRALRRHRLRHGLHARFNREPDDVQRRGPLRERRLLSLRSQPRLHGRRLRRRLLGRRDRRAPLVRPPGALHRGDRLLRALSARAAFAPDGRAR